MHEAVGMEVWGSGGSSPHVDGARTRKVKCLGSKIIWKDTQ